MAFFQSTESTTITAPLGARVASSTGGTIAVTVDPADGGANFTLNPHPAGYNTVDFGDTIVSATGNYNVDNILR